MSGIRPPDCSKLAKNPKNDNDVTIFRHDVNVKFFWRCFVSLVKFSCWSKFHVNIITGSGIMTIFFYKGLTRNLKIGNIPVWGLPNIWRLGRVMDSKFGTNVSNRLLLNAVKLKCYSFYCFWVIKGKPTKITPPPLPPPPRLELTGCNLQQKILTNHKFGSKCVVLQNVIHIYTNLQLLAVGFSEFARPFVTTRH